MSRYIDADDAIYRLEKMSYSDSQPKAIRRAGKYLNAFANEQPADVEEVRHGEWIDTGSGQKCSVCGEIQYGYDNYRYRCSYCGAKMDGGNNEN